MLSNPYLKGLSKEDALLVLDMAAKDFFVHNKNKIEEFEEALKISVEIVKRINKKARRSKIYQTPK